MPHSVRRVTTGAKRSLALQVGRTEATMELVVYAANGKVREVLVLNEQDCTELAGASSTGAALIHLYLVHETLSAEQEPKH